MWRAKDREMEGKKQGRKVMEKEILEVKQGMSLWRAEKESLLQNHHGLLETFSRSQQQETHSLESKFLNSLAELRADIETQKMQIVSISTKRSSGPSTPEKEGSGSASQEEEER